MGAKKGKAFRERPQVSVSIVSPHNPWHWVSASGRVDDIEPDPDLKFSDAWPRKHTGKDYERRAPR